MSRAMDISKINKNYYMSMLGDPSNMMVEWRSVKKLPFNKSTML